MNKVGVGIGVGSLILAIGAAFMSNSSKGVAPGIAKSRHILSKLDSRVASRLEEFIQRAYEMGESIYLTQGLRTFAEQDIIWNKGRTTPGNPPFTAENPLGGTFTSAKGGDSIHNYGLAADFAWIGVPWSEMNKASYLPKWKKMGALAKSLGLQWGGDWTKEKDGINPDWPHVQWKGNPPLSINQLKAGIKPQGNIA